jgi:hypothetical protein
VGTRSAEKGERLGAGLTAKADAGNGYGTWPSYGRSGLEGTVFLPGLGRGVTHAVALSVGVD